MCSLAHRKALKRKKKKKNPVSWRSQAIEIPSEYPLWLGIRTGTCSSLLSKQESRLRSIRYTQG